MLLPSIFGENLFDDMFDFDKEMNHMNRASFLFIYPLFLGFDFCYDT